MKLGKNSSKWISLSVIAVLLISFSFITVQSSLSIIHKLNSVVLTSDFSYDKETSESEKDFNEFILLNHPSCINQFHSCIEHKLCVI